MMNRLMSAVVRQVTRLKIQAELFQPAEMSVKTVLTLLLVLSRRNVGALLMAGLFFPVILRPALQNMWCKYPEENRDLPSLNTPMCFVEVISALGFDLTVYVRSSRNCHHWSEDNEQLLGVQYKRRGNACIPIFLRELHF